MKKIFYLLFLLPVIMISCESEPEAYFSVDEIDTEVGQKLLFTNESQNADVFEWDFGDGTVSYDVNPVHIYNSTGVFEVILIAKSANGNESSSSISITVRIPTLLEIEVLEYYDEYVVPDASVILYTTSVDWDLQTNMLFEGFTDEDGVVVFSNLEPYVHYVDVKEKNHNNYALRDEDIGFIRTPEILPHKINRFIAWVDYVESGKGIGRGSRELVIKKLERKSGNKASATGSPDTDGWEELYNRSIKK